jgi:transcriptional regulator with XRE-family HTH domain
MKGGDEMTGRSLKLLRISKDIPQWRLAQKVGITPAYLSAMENGRVEMSDEMEFLLKKEISQWNKEE